MDLGSSLLRSSGLFERRLRLLVLGFIRQHYSSSHAPLPTPANDGSTGVLSTLPADTRGYVSNQPVPPRGN